MASVPLTVTVITVLLYIIRERLAKVPLIFLATILTAALEVIIKCHANAYTIAFYFDNQTAQKEIFLPKIKSRLARTELSSQNQVTIARVPGYVEHIRTMKSPTN